jgi:hypothetical protein
MPRKDDSRLNDPWHPEPDLTKADIEVLLKESSCAPSNEKVRELAQMIGVDTKCNRRRIRSALINLTRQSKTWSAYEDNAPTRPETRKAFEVVLTNKGPIYPNAVSANSTAESYLIDQFWLHRKRTDLDADLMDFLDGRLPATLTRQLMQDTLEELKSARGRKPNYRVYYVVQELCRLFRCMTGQSVTHSSHERRIYTGDPKSKAGRFVKACLDVIDPSVAPSTISSALSRYMKNQHK